MSNLIWSKIAGTIPFNYYEDEQLARKFAFITSPTSGLKACFPEDRIPAIPNEHGGQTAMHRFEIFGEEALSIQWLDSLADRIESIGGTITYYVAQERESGTDLRVYPRGRGKGLQYATA